MINFFFWIKEQKQKKMAPWNLIRKTVDDESGDVTALETNFSDTITPSNTIPLSPTPYHNPSYIIFITGK